MKKYIQYDKNTGRIYATTSGKIRKRQDGTRYVEKPDESLLPTDIGMLEVDEDADTFGKQIKLADMSLEDMPKSEIQQFKEDWPYSKIIKHIKGGNGDRRKFIKAVTDLNWSPDVEGISDI